MNGWSDVCALSQVPIGRAVCVLIGGEQVALVRTTDDDLYAVGNYDPIGRAMVMSRGLVGSRGDLDVLVSPLHKQAYDLATGRCLDAEQTWLPVYDVQVVDGQVQVALQAAERQLA
jgi:nitrite reductase (NADH) small subunit